MFAKSGSNGVVGALLVGLVTLPFVWMPTPAEAKPAEPPAAPASAGSAAAPVASTSSPKATPSAPASAAPASPAPAASAAPAAPAAASSTAASEADAKPKVTVGGFVEAYYMYNFNQPANGVNAGRWLDSRHNSFELQAAVLDIQGELGPVSARVALQAGLISSASYPRPAPGADDAFRYVNQAYASYTAPFGKGLKIDAGIFQTTLGYEVIGVKDNPNFSYSNVFFGLPLNHTGVRASYEFKPKWTLMVMGVNGWAAPGDNNDGKSVGAQLLYDDKEKVAFSLHYMTGPERNNGSAEGPAFRHVVDAWVKYTPNDKTLLAVHVNGGVEPNRVDTVTWEGFALYARYNVWKWLHLAARADGLFEQGNKQTAVFFGREWLISGTLTADVRPVSNVSARLEYRHDQADADHFFGSNAALPTKKSQDTVLLGMTTWF